MFLTDSVCASETDSTWLITWSDTRTGYYDTQSCPSSQANLAGKYGSHHSLVKQLTPVSLIAYAFRLCELNGIWSDFVDTSCCKDLDFEIISNEVTNNFLSIVILLRRWKFSFFISLKRYFRQISQMKHRHR